MLSKQEKIKALKEFLGKSELDASVTGQTVGVHASSISPQLLIATSAKLVRVGREQEDPDDKDNLRYSTIHSLEDRVHESIMKDQGYYQRKAIQKLKDKKDLSWLNSGFFTPQIRQSFMVDSTTHLPDGVNPFELRDISHKVTKMGEGAIGSTDAIPAQAREVNGSYMGFLDVARHSESSQIGTDHKFSTGVHKGRDNKLYRQVLNSKGETVWIDHQTLMNSKVEIPEY